MKKLIFTIFASVMCLTSAYAAIIEGTCGDNLQWSLDDETYILTISGRGKMYNYTSGGAPWYEHRSRIETVKFGVEVSSIGNSAFYGCLMIKSMFIPSNIESIGFRAFRECSSLKIAFLGNGVKSIGEEAFYWCTSLNSIKLSEGLRYIGPFAFYNCQKLTKIEIPNSVNTIEGNAFSNCTSLTSAVLPNNLKVIKNQVFHNCSTLVSVNIPDSTKYIWSQAFYNCKSLKVVKFPDGLVEIGDRAFSSCDSLKFVEFPKSVNKIERGAFSFCLSLDSIHLSRGITEIGEGAFERCNISSVEIPLTMKRVSKRTFQLCENLQYVTIEKNVQGIGDYAFYGCGNIIEITIKTEISPNMTAETFSGNVKNKAKVYVPKGSLNEYMSDNQWRKFSNIQEYEVTDQAGDPNGLIFMGIPTSLPFDEFNVELSQKLQLTNVFDNGIEYNGTFAGIDNCQFVVFSNRAGEVDQVAVLKEELSAGAPELQAFISFCNKTYGEPESINKGGIIHHYNYEVGLSHIELVVCHQDPKDRTKPTRIELRHHIDFFSGKLIDGDI